MPEINKISKVLYDSNYPYHVHYDNLPLKNILERIDLVNYQVDKHSEFLQGSSGNSSTLSNRLSTSMDERGNLLSSSIDQANHSIASHTDDDNYVRMQYSERTKLEGIDSEANKLEINIKEIDGNIAVLENGTLLFDKSDSIYFEVKNPINPGDPYVLKANSVFPTQAAHLHHYGIVPNNISGGDFKTTTYSTPYINGTLRVYIEGVRINRYDEAGVNPSLSYQETNPKLGIFTIKSDNVNILYSELPDLENSMIIDFDQSYFNSQDSIKLNTGTSYYVILNSPE